VTDQKRCQLGEQRRRIAAPAQPILQGRQYGG
jgi:hypothetical protein